MNELPPRFLNWRLIDGRKVPCRADGTPCNAHDPANHTDYETAAASAHGVAFDIRAEDGLFFLDLDKCRAEDGAWTAEAEAIFLSFTGAWGEVSQSGTGLHIIGRCDPSKLQDRRNKWDGWLEFYTDGRFVAFGSTGWNPIGGTTRPDVDWTDQLLRMVPEREHLGELPEGVDPAYTWVGDDDALVAAMLASKGGAGAAFGLKATVCDLWHADTAVLAKHYPAFDGGGGFDHSSADAALMSHLAYWTGKDMPRMDRLFRRSSLMRDKYEKRADYRRDTVQNAARLCNKVYDRPVTPAATGGGTADVYMTEPDMAKHFAGCVYIRDLHRVLVPDGSLLKPEQFNASYGGHIFKTMPDGTKPTAKAFEALTENRAIRFPQAIRPCFRPDLPPGLILNDGSVNTYVKPDVDMTPGDVSRFLELMGKLLPDERDRQILLSYCASVVQNPGIKFQWTPVLQGCEGNGKTLIFLTVAYAVGERYSHMPNPRQIGGQFNGWIEGKIFSTFEEIHMEGRRETLDILKTIITNLRIEVENKGVDKRMIENRCNFGFCTNYQDAVIKSRNDRRYAIFFTAQQSIDDLKRDGMDGNYFPKLYDWLRDEGGYAAVAHYLTNYEIPHDLDPAKGCHRAPETSSTAAAVRKSRGPIETEILEAAEDNTPGFIGGWVSSWALDKLMRDRGFRIGRNKLADILADLGYEQWGRATSPLIQEDRKRPMLYKKPGASEDYVKAQHYPT
ncbi:DUF5906 domain-containing protein [Sedimentitalea sp. JM2-8]|uniref:DUF5906 domain-containing protein n=1 Tax=Sedimentitalea xiamensis TaxID=3050037 RepID=A0ABT7FG13_9RHOB|nr:DUF5906 domain-containing protein [Sedimentitalea xiamensis]MDK3074089.1 DUF5906 domain-containing protein [Sedimentitalea xiamensis]